MFRRSSPIGRWPAAGCILAAVLLFAGTLAAQERRSSRIDVEHYTIDAEINPRTQTITANVQMRFVPQEDATILQFEFNNALSLPKIVDDSGRELQASRSAENSQIRLSLPDALPKGKPSTLTFTYDGRLTGAEESPVYGIKFAAIQQDHAFLMYPSRWFPVNDYTVDRFTADIRIVVPAGFRAIASGVETSDTAPADKVAYRFKASTASFPGSIAVVKGEPKALSGGGVITTFFLRDTAEMAAAYGEEIGKVMAFLTNLYGLAPKANLIVVETEKGAPDGYSAPGVLFLSPRGIGKTVRTDLLVNQIARQWWGNMVSPATRNHLWWVNGLTRYAELQYLEQSNPGLFEIKIHDAYIEALTVEQPPLIQSARLEDYSPEYWAATGGKGAAVLNMLRYVIGDEAFLKTLKAFPEQYANKSASTNDFRKVAEQMSGESLQWFFTEWIESSGAPEFKLDYTVFR
ncbi:MAG: M1 family aminopeptidase, partial [Bryobacteraceae bacterium]